MVLAGATPALAEVDTSAAACGYDVCLSTTNGSATLYLEKLAGGARISLRVWVQDGASGAARYARSGTYTW